ELGDHVHAPGAAEDRSERTPEARRGRGRQERVERAHPVLLVDPGAGRGHDPAEDGGCAHAADASLTRWRSDEARPLSIASAARWTPSRRSPARSATTSTAAPFSRPPTLRGPLA